MKLRTSVLATIIASCLVLAACKTSIWTDIQNISTVTATGFSVAATEYPQDVVQLNNLAVGFTGIATAAGAAAQAGGNDLTQINAAIQSADTNLADFEGFVKNPGTASALTALAGIAADALAEITAYLQPQGGSNGGSANPNINGATIIKFQLKTHGTATGKTASTFRQELKEAGLGK